LVERFIRVGLLSRMRRSSVPGYQIHEDFAGQQWSREKVLSERAKTASRKARWAAKERTEEATKRETEQDNSSGNAVRNALVTALPDRSERAWNAGRTGR
jgi:hypothetical protein